MTTKERIALLEEKVEYLNERMLNLEHPSRLASPKPNPFAENPSEVST